MAILNPTTGTPSSNQWGPTTKQHFNEFEVTNSPVCMAGVRTSVLNPLIEWAIERPEYDSSNTAIGTASADSTDSVILVDSYGKATRAVAGTHYMSPTSNTNLQAGNYIYLTNATTGYINGDGNAKFQEADVGTLKVDSLQLKVGDSYQVYTPFVLKTTAPTPNDTDTTRLWINTETGIMYYSQLSGTTVTWTPLGAVFK